MKFSKIFAAAICAASLFNFAFISADVIPNLTDNLNWFSARTETGFIVDGAVGESLSTSGLAPISFDHYRYQLGGGVKGRVDQTIHRVELAEGSYFVSFTGSFNGSAIDQGDGAYVNVAFRVSDVDNSRPPRIHFENQGWVYSPLSGEPPVLTISGIIYINHDDVVYLEVVGLSTSTSEDPIVQAAVYNRNLSIINLDK